LKHPFDFIPEPTRKPLFFTLFVLTVIMVAVFRYLDQPLRTSIAPNGIVSFEFARTPEKAFQIMVSWEPNNVTGPEIIRFKAYLYAAFSLGIDYLFMPIYASTLSLSTLLAAGRHKGWLNSLGVIAGWGAIGAAVFDAVENYALLRVLLGNVTSPHPGIAAICAGVKFSLILLALIYILVGWVWPRTIK
jgi:hypothetical protein